MAFADALSAIPFAGGPTATGFLPPFIRTMSHLLYVLGMVAEDAVNVSNADAIEEIIQAGNHWRNRSDAANASLSSASVALAGAFETLIDAAIAEFPDWTDDQKIANLRDLVNRGAALGAALDRELLGITGSNPGIQM